MKITSIINTDKIELGNLSIGDTFKLGDEEFIVLEHTDDCTRVITKKFSHSDIEFGSSSDWRTSSIRAMLYSDYLKKISSIVGEDNIIIIDRDLTSFDGSDNYGSCTDKISLLTFAEYVKYYRILDSWFEYPQAWWLITPASAPTNDCFSRVCVIESGGMPSWRSQSDLCSIRPFFTFKSSTLVVPNEDYNILLH